MEGPWIDLGGGPAAGPWIGHGGPLDRFWGGPAAGPWIDHGGDPAAGPCTWGLRGGGWALRRWSCCVGVSIPGLSFRHIRM